MSSTSEGPPYGAGLSMLSLQELWDIVEPQDHGNGYTHPDAWRHMGELCTAMAQKLRETGTAIADRWPPERSRAAAAFKARLELLATAFDGAGQVGTANAPRLFDLQITNASLRGDISRIVDRYTADNDRANARIKVLQSQPTTYPQPGTPPQTATQDQLLAATNEPQVKNQIDAKVGPLPNNWKATLESQAKLTAYQYENDLAGYKGTFAQPKPIDPTLTPPATPNTPGGGGGSYGSPIGTGLRIPPPLVPTQPPIDPGTTSGNPSGGSSDPILDQLPGGSITGGAPGGYDLPGAGAPIPGGSTVPWIPTAGGGYAMAPGGVIGEPIGTPLGAGSGAAAAIARAAGPGVLGAGATGRAATGSGFVAPPGGMIGGQRGGPGGRGGAPGSRRRPDDDQSFMVPEGVPPVLVPPAELNEHQPGPGVIGIDR